MNRVGFPSLWKYDSSWPLVRRPAWMGPLSADLRVRFCRALDGGLSARAAARKLDVSAATGVRWANAWRTKGSIAPGKMGGHVRPLLEGEREWLLARLGEEKDLAAHGPLGGVGGQRGVE